ncbi:palmitoyl-protein thioesterase 1 [Phtheirospermum japonicum]|uniref:Palmitoyl-protein thioesterase 1 n=1 Tax=Phtheirospermum japonicum TaxID=374723 RepID=A0A830DF05_9LAMI|nr:palmitoyl-protein thioesterase 1 [Phtheirospermum japonicum]
MASFKYFMMIFTIFSIVGLCLVPRTVYSIPFVVFHGISDGCRNNGITHFTTLLSNWSGSQGHCIEIGNGAWDSWTMPFLTQTAIACEKVKKIKELSEGYNIIGLSQGNLVGRGVVELCDDGPPVRNLISLAGPHAGIAAVPLCGSGLVCILVDFLIELAIYSDYVQEHLAPACYIKIPTDLDNYRKGCRFLPKLNNELYKNSTYKERFSSLDNLVLIKFEKDKVLVPKETSWFGYFPDGSWETILPAQETTLYTEDWIGLKTLDEAGKVKFVNVSGGHLEISYGEMKKYVVPYLVNNVTEQQTLLEHFDPQSGLDEKVKMFYIVETFLSEIFRYSLVKGHLQHSLQESEKWKHLLLFATSKIKIRAFTSVVNAKPTLLYMKKCSTRVNVALGENYNMLTCQVAAIASCINCNSEFGAKFVALQLETGAIRNGRFMIDMQETAAFVEREQDGVCRYRGTS